MKDFIRIITIAVVIMSCTESGNIGPMGPVGPRGPQGPEGAPGESGYVFEYSNINFTAPDYAVVLPHPEGFEGLASDVAIVYLLWDVLEVDGGTLDVWRPLPQTIITEDGLLLYNFDFTAFDVRLFLEANYPLDLLTAIDTDEWIARVVIVPGEFWGSGRVDFSDYHEVSEALGLPDLDTDLSGAIKRR